MVDLGEIKPITEVSARFLQDSRAWILLPRHFSVSTSVDGVNYTPWTQEVSLKDQWEEPKTLIVKTTLVHTDEKSVRSATSNEQNTSHVEAPFIAKPIKAKYVKIRADKYGLLPKGHLGYPYNGRGYIFMDEITVR